MKRLVLGFLSLPAAWAFAQSASAPALPSPEPAAPVASVSVPVDPSKLEWPDTPAGRLMREGIKLHDRGDFTGALKKYRAALELQPNDKSIRYEIANSQHAAGDGKAAADTALAALAGPGSNPPELFVLLGNYHDGEGRPGEAIRAYRKGLDEWPDYFNLHFNLGVTLTALKRYPEARAEFQRAVRANPDHASSHYHLGLIYAATGYPVPAIMALGRFLMLEPGSSRAENALGALDELLRKGVTTDSKKNPKEVTVIHFTKMARDEGPQEKPYTDVRRFAAEIREKISGKSTSVTAVMLGYLLCILSNPHSGAEKPSGFADAYYLPFYREIERRDEGSVYTDFVFNSESGRDLKALKGEDRKKVEEFRDWTAAFKWNAEAPIHEPEKSATEPAAAPASAPSSAPTSAPAPLTSSPPASEPKPN